MNDAVELAFIDELEKIAAKLKLKDYGDAAKRLVGLKKKTEHTSVGDVLSLLAVGTKGGSLTNKIRAQAKVSDWITKAPTKSQKRAREAIYLKHPAYKQYEAKMRLKGGIAGATAAASILGLKAAIQNPKIKKEMLADKRLKKILAGTGAVTVGSIALGA